MPIDAKFVLAGLLVGTLVGFTGMGGGSVMTPLLIWMGLPAAKAIGSDLFYSAVTKTLGSWRHAKKDRVDWTIAKWLAIGSVPASVAGVFTNKQIVKAMGNNGNNLLKQLLGIMLICVGVSILYRFLLVRKNDKKPPRRIDGVVDWTRKKKITTVSIGALGGYGVGLTSIGSGTLFVVFLMAAFPLAAQRIVGTDIFHATLLVWAAALAHTVAGNVEFNNVAWLLVGSLPGILIGTRLTGRLPERPMRIALGAVLVLSGSLLY